MTEKFTPTPMPTDEEEAAAKAKREFLPNHGYFYAQIESAEIKPATADKGETKEGDIIRTSKQGDKFIFVNVKLDLSLPDKDQHATAFVSLCVGLWYGLEKSFLSSFGIAESEWDKPETWNKKSKMAIVKRKPTLLNDAYKSDGEFQGFATRYGKDGEKMYLMDEICEILPMSKRLPEDLDEEFNNQLYENFFFNSKKQTADTQPGFEAIGTASTPESQAGDQSAPTNSAGDLKNF
jgi:hypothetical protein